MCVTLLRTQVPVPCLTQAFFSHDAHKATYLATHWGRGTNWIWTQRFPEN